MPDLDPEVVAYILIYIYTGVFPVGRVPCDHELQHYLVMFLDSNLPEDEKAVYNTWTSGKQLLPLVKVYMAADSFLLPELRLLCRQRIAIVLRHLGPADLDEYIKTITFVYTTDTFDELRQLLACPLHFSSNKLLRSFTDLRGESLLSLFEEFPDLAFNVIAKCQILKNHVCTNWDKPTHELHCPNGDYHFCGGICARIQEEDLTQVRCKGDQDTAGW